MSRTTTVCVVCSEAMLQQTDPKCLLFSSRFWRSTSLSRCSWQEASRGGSRVGSSRARLPSPSFQLPPSPRHNRGLRQPRPYHAMSTTFIARPSVGVPLDKRQAAAFLASGPAATTRFSGAVLARSATASSSSAFFCSACRRLQASTRSHAAMPDDLTRSRPRPLLPPCDAIPLFHAPPPALPRRHHSNSFSLHDQSFASKRAATCTGPQRAEKHKAAPNGRSITWPASSSSRCRPFWQHAFSWASAPSVVVSSVGQR